MKKTVNIMKANVQSVAHQLSHRRAAVHAAGWLPRRQWCAAAD